MNGKIFVANCGNDSVSEFVNGDPNSAINIPLGATPLPGEPGFKPFGIALDTDGNAWVTNNFNDTISIIAPAGQLIHTLPALISPQPC